MSMDYGQWWRDETPRKTPRPVPGLARRMAFWTAFYMTIVAVGLLVLSFYDPTQTTTLHM